jgi:phosphatidylinositol alpha-1,6-mannosyltransferase
MRVLLLSQVFPPQTGGSGRWFWEIYRRLPREAVGVVAGEQPGAAEFDATHDVAVERRMLSFPSLGLASFGGLRRYLSLALRLRRRILDERIDMVHCGCTWPEGVAAWLAKMMTGTPFLLYVHGEELSFPSRELAWLRRRVFGAATMVIANSKNTLRLLRDDWNVPESKLKLLHPGVDIERFTPAEPCVETRERLGWAGRTVIMTAGRLQKRKGQDMLIRAIPQIRERVPDVLYSIVGDGAERAALEQLVDSLGLRNHVQFRGDADDSELICCYQQCDLFALPNRTVGGDFEGFGMVLLEAQACGKAVLAGDSGGTAETMSLGDAGVPQTGEIVDCTEPEPLAARIIGMLADRDRLAEMSLSGREWAESRFSWDVLSCQAMDIFDGNSPTDISARPMECSNRTETEQVCR